MLKKFGGFVQGQYYFNNQWFANALYAFSKAYNVTRSRYARGGMMRHYRGTAHQNMEMAFDGDNASTIQQVDLTLWYRPIQAIKFGLQYSYMAVNYLQNDHRSGWSPLTPPGLGTTTGWSSSGSSTSNLKIG